MVSVTVVVCVMPPPFAVTVIVRVPSEAFLPTRIVIVEVPDPPEIELGLNVTVCEPPCPEADKLIAEPNPPVAAAEIVTFPDAFLATVIVVGDAETVNPAVTPEVTVSETVVVCVRPPPVPVIVITYVPAATVEATANVTVEEPEPGAAIDNGLKLTVTPLGAPDALSATEELNPPDTEVVIVELPLLPAATETVAGEAEIVNAGVCVVEPVSELIKPAFGLPHPVTRSYPVTAE